MNDQAFAQIEGPSRPVRAAAATALTSEAGYRPDIDGLRAIAVCSVIAFHARNSWIPGGFTGVDIFFTISGYLISKHIATQAIGQRFSMAEFYRRRIRRIMPMMFTVIATVVALAAVLMTREDGREVAKSATWSIFSMANVYFWRDLDTGYFAQSSAEVPLLHLWSLGIEEQFYLCWPVILLVGLRNVGRVGLLACLSVLALCSFGYGSYTLRTDPSFAYYMLPSRAGELLCGAFGGVSAALGIGACGARGARVAATLGAILLLLAFGGLSHETPFPGWAALVPTLGASLLIYAGEHRRQPCPGLASRPMVWIGKVSYSAYLWHWPLFALFRYGYGEPGTREALAIIAITFALAWVSFHLVEMPTRHSRRPFRSVFLRQFVIPGSVVAGASVFFIYAERLHVPVETASHRATVARLREDVRPPYSYPWICQRQVIAASLLLDEACVAGAPGVKPSVFLWGDSNAAHYVPMMDELARRAGFSLRNAEVGSCPPVLTAPNLYSAPDRQRDCVISSTIVGAELAKYPIVVIGADWVGYVRRSPAFLDAFLDGVRAMTDRGQTVVLLGRVPMLKKYDRRCAEKALRLPLKRCDDVDQPEDPEVTSVNRALAAFARTNPRVGWFDPTPFLCPRGACALRTDDGKPRYFDAGHLTVLASRELGEQVARKNAFPTLWSRPELR